MIRNNLQFSLFLISSNVIALILLISSLLVDNQATKKTLVLIALGTLIFQKAIEFFISVEKMKKISSFMILAFLIAFFIFFITK